MGRPLNKKFFGNRNIGSASTTADNGIGGQAVASIAVTGTFSGKTTATAYAVTISAPNLPTGVQAVATITFSSATAGTVTVTEGGSGYTTVPTATCTLGGGTGNPTLTAVLSVDTGNVGSLTNDENAISMTAFLTGGSALAVDIKKQVSGRRYKVTDGTRTGVVKLKSTAASAAGEATIVATDSIGATYFVTKLTGKRATLTQKTAVAMSPGGNTWVFITGASAPWSFNSATTGRVQIDNA
jgi:hypothetical protein